MTVTFEKGKTVQIIESRVNANQFLKLKTLER